jgi:hypothetical protein
MLVSHAKFHRALRRARVNHERPTAVVVGAGDVGSSVLRHLAGSGEFGELWALDIDVERAGVAVHDAVAIASYTGSAPSPRVAAADVLSVDELATILSHVSPDVIVQTTTLQSWWVITQLPQDLWRRLEREARFGPWLPFHLVPTASVLAAARKACPATPVVNVAFPDAVNAVLAALGTPATTGAGNSELLTPGIRRAAAELLGAPVERVTLEWIGHHYHVVYYWMELEQVEPLDPDSFHLRVLLDGDDVTAQVDVPTVLVTAGRMLPKGRLIGERAAASAAKNARMLLRPGSIDDHVSSACGLAGGCDVRFRDGTVELQLPSDVDIEATKRIMARAQLGDGIAGIDDQGVVAFTDSAAGAMRDLLGYDCQTLRPEDAPDRVAELRDRLANLTAA